MPRIPPPILSLLKIQITHLILDGETDLAKKLSIAMLIIEKGPEVIEQISKKLVEGDEGLTEEEKMQKQMENKPIELSLGEKIQKAIERATNSGKIFLVENTLVSLAQTVDTMNAFSFDLVEPGFQRIKVVNKSPVPNDPVDYNEYWFDSEDREIKSKDSSRFFKNEIKQHLEDNTGSSSLVAVDANTFKFNGDLGNDREVDKYVKFMLYTVNPLEYLTQIKNAISRIVTKIRIFIYNIYKGVALAIRVVKTGIQVGQDSADAVSLTAQTVVTTPAVVGAPSVSVVSV